MGERRAGLVRAGFRRANTPATTATGSSTPADWASTLVRYFLLDPTNGSDSNLGYVDAAAGATLTPAGLAMKTIAGLQSIIPVAGNGRTAVVLQMAGTLTESIDLSRYNGYARFIWRGSTDLTNSVSDRITCASAIAVAGPGGSSEYTATAGATTTTVPIAVGTFGAEPACIQFRIRFLATTTTAALQNICRTITAHTTTVLTLGNALPATPATGDTFVIERPGAVVAGVTVNGWGAAQPATTFFRYQLVGIGCTSTTANGFLVSVPLIRIAFCECKGATNNRVFAVQGANSLSIQGSWADETDTARTVGTGLRLTTGSSWTDVYEMAAMGMGFMNTSSNGQPLLTQIYCGGFGALSYFAIGARFLGCGPSALADSDGSTAASFVIGDVVTTNAQPRVNSASSSGGISIAYTSAVVSRIAFSNCTNACVKMQVAAIGGTLVFDGCTGSSGNTDVGLFVDRVVSGVMGGGGTTIVVGRHIVNTVTGTHGDVQIGGAENAGAPAGVYTTWVALTENSFRDHLGNLWTGLSPAAAVAGDTTGIVQGHVFTNGDGGAHAVGDIVRVSAAGTVVQAQADTSAHADGPLLVAISPPAAAALGLYAALMGDGGWVNCGAAPTVPALLYLDPATAGRATATVPAAAATNQKRRLGYAAKAGAGALANFAWLVGSPELLTVTSDGVAP